MTSDTGNRLACVLDDEPHVAAIVCQHLQANSYSAQSFGAVMPFLAEVKATNPELIVLDLALGKSDAVEVIRHLKAIHFSGKVLLISGHDEATLARISEIGTTHNLAMLPPLQKPFRASDIKRSILAEPLVATGKEQGKAAADARPSLSVNLGQALRNNWLELWYQPKVSLRSLTLSGAEALLRGRHPEHGVLSPAQILPPAGDPLYQPLTEFVLARAIEDWRRFSKVHQRLKLAVNIPLSALQSANFMTGLREVLPQDPSFPGLIVEITEDEAVHDSEIVREIAAQLKLYNISLSIDDFGAGYSSFARLQELPFSEIKLDRSFVSNCAADGAKQSLCSAAIELAHGFGATVCAEGVESIPDLKTLIEMRCTTAQGYLFSKPLSAKDFFDKISAPSSSWKPAA
ncbi:MAG: EAL domain-containing protein [Pseudolabrys sp.]